MSEFLIEGQRVGEEDFVTLSFSAFSGRHVLSAAKAAVSQGAPLEYLNVYVYENDECFAIWRWKRKALYEVGSNGRSIETRILCGDCAEDAEEKFAEIPELIDRVDISEACDECE